MTQQADKNEPLESAQAEAYGAESIKVLRGLEAVRKRPGMYIGDTDDGSGLHHLVYEVVDNSIDESLAGHCDLIEVILNGDGSVTVRDNGRGIPVGIHAEEGVSAAEVIMTQLHAGGKFDQNSYKVSGGLHGVGVSVVNALSEWLQLTIWRDGKEHAVRFADGNVLPDPLGVVGEAEARSGTEISFLPSKKTFTMTEFDFATLEHRLRELAFSIRASILVLIDAASMPRPRPSMHVRWRARGLRAVSSIAPRTRCSSRRFRSTASVPASSVEAALEWNDSYHETVLCFTNNIPQRDGGTHLAGFRAALTRQINAYAVSSGIAKAREGQCSPAKTGAKG